MSLTSQFQAIEFNGIDALTGHPLLRLSPLEIERIARGERLEPAHFRELRDHWLATKDLPCDVVQGVDVSKLAQSGWGVIWPHGAEPAVRSALAELIKHRREQAGDRFRELTYRPNESANSFLERHGIGPGPVDPKKLPYHLLIVGSPQEIPFSFQYRLDVQFSVGRLSFDRPEDFARYAESVIAAEKGKIRRRREVALLAPKNRGDRATERSARDLVAPLAELENEFKDWQFHSYLGPAATKARFGQVLGGPEAPALAFVACHGLGYPSGHANQRAGQGALVCQDWPGPDSPVSADHIFAAADVTDQASVAGQIAFVFACFGAGTPELEDFYSASNERQRLAEKAFIAELPKRLLSHPRGSALAVIGHVERAWTYSFDWPQAGPQRAVFESAIGRLLDGYPVGAALEYFGQRYAELAIDVKKGHNDLEYDEDTDLIGIAGRVLAFKDARAYTLLGDPAVKLAVV